ncbi:hypothetical protein KFL_002370080 [Klebsormidium nitens]|uniref:Cytochrome c oxidase assembly protein COX16 n=1 Tax=Klebsormidium nitens TaxID=105231 RepID=A0A1Y1I3G6_KLENI|nr:hypothetical protein KFL_002370080 [Klebsormidium nitens]|eukprot:GAQ85474.1 hypothetical protein KFL_002370080 [Klebsormidium nitens]
MDQVRKRRAGGGGPFLRFGLPMTVFSVVGFYGLVHLTQGRREMINAHSPAQLQPLNKEGELKSEGKKLDLNEELRKLNEKVNINDYENKPVPKLSSDE